MMRRAFLLCNGNGGVIRLNFQQQTRSFKYSPILRDCKGAARVRYVKAVEPTNEGYIAKNTRMGRPFASGLWTYKKQLTSILSITNRLSAIYLSMQVAAIGLACLCACRKKHNFNDFMTWLESKELENRGIFIMKTLIAFPFIYHTCMGLRHLVWDTGRFLTIPGVYTTGYLALFAVFILTGVLAACGIRSQPLKEPKRPKRSQK